MDESTPTLRTERLELRPVSEDDIDRILEYRNLSGGDPVADPHRGRPRRLPGGLEGAPRTTPTTTAWRWSLTAS